MNIFLKVILVSGFFVLLTNVAVDSASAATVVDAQPFTIAERGPNHRIWEKVALVTDDAGNTSTVTNSYTELGTGLHRLDPATGQWVESVPQFELFEGGVVARQTQHKVILAPNPNTPNAVDLLMSDNGRLVSHVVGLIYFDRASGKSVTLAVIKDAQGILQPGNQEVIFPDAFDGPFRASLRYRISLAGLSQDVILEERPDDPEAFGLSSKSTEISVVTEFVQAPQPTVEVRVIREEKDQQVRQAMVEPDLLDEYLNFGAMQMGFGRGLLMNGQPESLPDGSLPVLKHWQTAADGRTFLHESIQLTSIADALKTLPAPKQANRTSANRAKALVSNGRSAPPTALKKQSPTSTIRVAQLAYPGTGFVLDYSILNSSPNFTFQADVTFFVTSSVNLSGTTTI